jgi:hypothetical protein
LVLLTMGRQSTRAVERQSRRIPLGILRIHPSCVAKEVSAPLCRHHRTPLRDRRETAADNPPGQGRGHDLDRPPHRAISDAKAQRTVGSAAVSRLLCDQT